MRRSVRFTVCSTPTGHDSNRLRPALPRADADAILQWQNENLAVADAPFRSGAPRFHDGVHRRLDEVLIDGDLQLDLVDQPHRQLMAAVDLRVALLPAEPLHINDRQPKDLDFVQSLFDGLQLGGRDDGVDEFHGRRSVAAFVTIQEVQLFYFRPSETPNARQSLGSKCACDVGFASGRRRGSNLPCWPTQNELANQGNSP